MGGNRVGGVALTWQYFCQGRFVAQTRWDVKFGDIEKDGSLHFPKDGGNLGASDTAGCGQIVSLGKAGEMSLV